MSPATCSTCGTPHGPERRYCLACGTLVGRRPVDPLRAGTPERAATPPATSAPIAPAAIGPVPTSAPVGATAPAVAEAAVAASPDAGHSLWRRPATSILTAVALATGLTAGFLLEPQGGAAVGPGATAAARSDGTAPGAATPPAAGTTTADGAPQAAAEEASDTAPATTEDAGEPATADPAAAPATATPQLADATAALPAAGTAPAPADAAGVPTDAPAGDGKSADDGEGGEAKTAPADTKGAKGAKDTKSTPVPAKRAGDAAGLPRIDHVWVVGIGTPVAARDGSYLGETLLAAATELPKYAPGATDPVAGAAALVAGRGPSASAPTIAGQLTAAKRPWRAYAPGTPSCTDAPAANPFLAFGSVTSAADCQDRLAGLDALPADLRSADATPAFSYVATDPTLDAEGLDAQLRQVVEPIRRSAAFKRSGLIAIVPTAAPAATTTGALILSPFAAGSTAIGTAFGPYSLLRTFADLLGLERLGHAADSGVRGLGPEVLTPKD